MSFNTAAKVPPMGSGGIPPAPPTQFQRSQTLFVSKTGDDATAAREDGIYVYDTIAGALADALAGDTVVVFPGTYAEGNLVVPASVNMHFIAGAIVNAPVDSDCIVLSNNNIKITGDGQFSATGTGSEYAAISNTGTNNYVEFLRCSAFGALGLCAYLIDGSCSIFIKEKMILEGDYIAIFIGGGEHVINGLQICDAGANRDTLYALISIIGSLSVNPLKVNISVDKIISTNCTETVQVLIGASDNKVIINAQIIQNNYTGTGDVGIVYFSSAIKRRGDCVLLDIDAASPTTGYVEINAYLNSTNGVGIYRYNISGVPLGQDLVTAVFNTNMDVLAGFYLYAFSNAKMFVNGVINQAAASNLGYNGLSDAKFPIYLTGKINDPNSGDPAIKIWNDDNTSDYAQLTTDMVIVSKVGSSPSCIEAASANAINVIVYNLFSNVAPDVLITELVSNSIIDTSVQ